MKRRFELYLFFRANRVLNAYLLETNVTIVTSLYALINIAFSYILNESFRQRLFKQSALLARDTTSDSLMCGGGMRYFRDEIPFEKLKY